MDVRAFIANVAVVFWAREKDGQYSWRSGLGAFLATGVPLEAGVASDHLQQGSLAAMGALLTAISPTSGNARARVMAKVRGVLLLSAATAIGILVAGRLIPALCAIMFFSLLVPVRPTAAIAPLIALILAAAGSPVDPVAHVALVATGASYASAIMLLPFIAGPPDPQGPKSPPLGCRRAWNTLRSAARELTPEFRYGFRLAFCFGVAYTIITVAGLPHYNWVMLGIVTTLRPSWSQTTQRIIKRMGGTLLGSCIGALLLTFADSVPASVLALLCAALIGAARPLRSINYGLWPLVETPAILLMLTFGEHAGWIDALERVINNAVGAGLAAIGTLVLWPHHEEARILNHITEILVSQARYLERVAESANTPSADGQSHALNRVEESEKELAVSRLRLGGQPHPSAALLTELDAILSESGRLRRILEEVVPSTLPRSLFTVRELDILADRLRGVADALGGSTIEIPPLPFCGPVSRAGAALAEHAISAAVMVTSHSDKGL
ncbi:FUSC family protein [Streptomyces vinaceus]|uniref:FUSC family protein n=1 Tax=Streptomyces vinaceus TaxID=1960 RepID=UPI0037F2A423